MLEKNRPGAKKRAEEKWGRREILSRAAAVGAGAAALGVSLPELEAASEPLSPRVFDVTRFGGRGDGKADDTAAVQAAIDHALKAGGGRVHIPSGLWRVTKTLVVKSAGSLDLTGDGLSSVLLHEAPEHLFMWKENVSFQRSSVRNLHFRAVGEKSPETAALAFLGGAERAVFFNLFFDGPTGSGIVTEKVCDTVTVAHCLMWGGISGTGLKIARGSEVRVFGGRIIGKHGGVSGTGVHLVENNGGVHIVTTDLIALETGLLIGEAGRRSNREIFITHATMDGCRWGLRQVDHSYVSVAGLWAASSDEAQITLEKSARGAILVISGGTIFNGGAIGRPGAHNGIVVLAGSFVLNGVTVRHNKGTGILVAGKEVRDYTISGCRIADNGTGAVLEGNGYAVTGNVFARNGRHLVDRGGPDKVVQGNVIPA